MIWRQGPGHGRGGFTLVELLVAVAVVGALTAIGAPIYIGCVQRARETVLIHYLAEIHKGELAWRLETDSPNYAGDFDELEESGLIPGADFTQKARKRAPRRGPTKPSSSRLVQNYQVDLSVQDDPSANTYTYSVTASPQNRSQRVRWFFLDQTGVIRAEMGKQVGPSSAPAS